MCPVKFLIFFLNDVVTVDPGSRPDHEIFGGRLSKVERPLGEGEYQQDVHMATCSLVPNRQEGEEGL
jgi:hypothetical protein